ncbi:hypothetical protein COLO4_00151 [Corchorus olitorius]|uniref:Uncharacterized protein n=1 Tax=Corchorus olitorius TaxID=93759 RepID=A0A1R3L4G6_9ROSI|nr:hypothetical protein COLO4_00151 [Corchorus olitorius]
MAHPFKMVVQIFAGNRGYRKVQFLPDQFRDLSHYNCFCVHHVIQCTCIPFFHCQTESLCSIQAMDTYPTVPAIIRIKNQAMLNPH